MGQICAFSWELICIEIIGYASVLLFVIIAICYDLKCFCIPNKLNITGILCGVLYTLAASGGADVPGCMIWIVFPVFVLFPFFSARVMGAGDIKLFSVIGAFLGSNVCHIMIISFIIAAFWGLCTVLFRLAMGEKVGFTKIHMSIPIGAAIAIWILIRL